MISENLGRGNFDVSRNWVLRDGYYHLRFIQCHTPDSMGFVSKNGVHVCLDYGRPLVNLYPRDCYVVKVNNRKAQVIYNTTRKE